MKNSILRAAVALALAHAGTALAAPPSNSAYATDPQNTYVEDATSRGIGQVNMITCIMHALRADALVNDGAYNALVDQVKCDSEGRSSTDNASADGAQSSSFMSATVNSTRASNDDPMRARIWLDDPESEGANIFVNLSASAAPSASNPYGVFRVDYCGAATGSTQCMFNGFLEGAASGVSYFEREERDQGGTGTKALRMTASSTTSGAGTLQMEGDEGSSTYSFAYNADYYRRSDDSGEQCFARDARDADTGMSVWRYGLYNADTGARVVRNSGFPIEYTHSGTKYQGFLGYWGLSLPQAAMETLTNGATVEKVDYSSGQDATRTPYTVVRSSGKLLKFTRHVRNLAGIDHIKFNTFVGQEASGFFPGAQANAQYELYWDEAAGNFKVTAMMVCGPNGCSTQPLETEQSVAASFWQARGGVQGWSQTLGGEVFVDLHAVSGAPDSSAVPVVYRSQDVVYPSDLPASLHCVRDCPTVASMAGYFVPGGQGTQSPYAPGTANNFQATPVGLVVNYSSDAANAVLLDGSAQPVVLGLDREAMQQFPQYSNGLRTGKLFANLSDAECATGSGTYCEWKVNNLEVYYQWETGPNNWNQFAAVKDANGAFVNLEPPLQVSFNVPQGAAYGEYAGQSILLQYGGYGDLWGIPGVCVSRFTNLEVPCENNEEARYVPSFVIPQDLEVGRVTEGGNSYLVKWLDREIRFARKNLSVCNAAGLVVPSSMTLPTANDLRNPSDPASSVYVGTRPTVTAPARVVHGEVKY
jgi:hypothetical protein